MKNQNWRKYHNKTKALERRLRRLERNPNYEKDYARKCYNANPQYQITLTTKWHKTHNKYYNADDVARYYTTLKDHCEVCGATDRPLERMHLDYLKPLDIVTSCRKCHKKFDWIQREYGFEDIFPEPNTRHCKNCLKHFPNCERKTPSFKGRNCQTWLGEEKPFVETTWYILDDPASYS